MIGMAEKRSDEIEGKMELSHDAIAPYKAVLLIASIIAALYLGIIFVNTL